MTEQSEQADFWLDRENAQKAQQRLAQLRRSVSAWTDLRGEISDTIEMLQLAEEEGDAAYEKEMAERLPELTRRVDQQELAMMMTGEHDRRGAIVTIHPGAGGTESQDWASMLHRMYLRWCEARGFKAEVVDLQPGDQAGIKSATFTVNGDYAYGYLRSEAGIHRMVRISPFDSSGRRHTSFAAADITPDLDDSIEVEIEESDLRIDTFRSGGPGGQHANMTDSAVRMTHLPTGIFVVCRNERSQHKNRATALRILKSRLYARAQEEQEQELAKQRGKKREIAFGSQIRSYFFHPQKRVKDHRTGMVVGNAGSVMNGDIDPFIEAYLKNAAKKAAAEDAENNENDDADA